MKKFNLNFILLFLITIILFNSCEKRKIENCFEEILGTYDLLSDCNGDPSNEYIGIVSEGLGKEEGSITIVLSNITLEGYINDKDCNITFHKSIQEYYSQPDYEISIGGTGFFQPETGNLLCTLIISVSENGIIDPSDNGVCNFSFRKQ